LIFSYLWERQGFKEYDKDDFEKETEKEFKKAGRDVIYWISKEKLESIKNPLHRKLKRITQKVRGL
jgi:hypothetical protein